MKVYISADIEGVCGSVHWDEAEKGKKDYSEFQRQMTAEVSAACEGALAAGADEIIVKDAHANGRNIIADDLPRQVRLIRGWSGHPYSMVQELDDSFDAVMFVGYHARAGSDGNPLAHTMRGSFVDYMKINGQLASEFSLHLHVAARHNVPAVFLSGDEDICSEAQSILPSMSTVSVKKGIGNSAINIHPAQAIDSIRIQSEAALGGEIGDCLFPQEEKYEIEIRFKQATQAFKAAFYPGAVQLNQQTVKFEATDYFEIMRMRSFVI